MQGSHTAATQHHMLSACLSYGHNFPEVVRLPLTLGMNSSTLDALSRASMHLVCTPSNNLHERAWWHKQPPQRHACVVAWARFPSILWQPQTLPCSNPQPVPACRPGVVGSKHKANTCCWPCANNWLHPCSSRALRWNNMAGEFAHTSLASRHAPAAGTDAARSAGELLLDMMTAPDPSHAQVRQALSMPWQGARQTHWRCW